MAYSAWRKAGEVVTPARVVGLAVERLWQAEVSNDLSRVTPEHCSNVSLWSTQHWTNGRWGRPCTCVVALERMHMELAFYVWQRMCVLLHGLGLAVVEAVRSKARGEGSGQHDLILKHSGVSRYCSGFLSAEIKVGRVGADGRAFEPFWRRHVKGKTAEALKAVLRGRTSPFGAAMLIVVGVCDSEQLSAKDPPLLVRAQLMVVKSSGVAAWGDRILDHGPLPVTLPPAKRQRRNAIWDGVRAAMHGHSQDFGGTEYFPLAQLFTALGSGCKSPGQKMQTYTKQFAFKLGRDFVRKRLAGTRGSVPYWVTWAAAEKIAGYENGQ